MLPPLHAPQDTQGVTPSSDNPMPGQPQTPGAVQAIHTSQTPSPAEVGTDIQQQLLQQAQIAQTAQAQVAQQSTQLESQAQQLARLDAKLDALAAPQESQPAGLPPVDPNKFALTQDQADALGPEGVAAIERRAQYYAQQAAQQAVSYALEQYNEQNKPISEELAALKESDKLRAEQAQIDFGRYVTDLAVSHGVNPAQAAADPLWNEYLRTVVDPINGTTVEMYISQASQTHSRPVIDRVFQHYAEFKQQREGVAPNAAPPMNQQGVYPNQAMQPPGPQPFNIPQGGTAPQGGAARPAPNVSDVREQAQQLYAQRQELTQQRSRHQISAQEYQKQLAAIEQQTNQLMQQQNR